MHAFLLLSSLVLLQACGDRHRDRTDDDPLSEGPTLDFELDPDLAGLRLALSEVERSWEPSGASTPLANPQILSDPATDALLKRVPELESQEGDRLPFAKRGDSKPPALTGEDVQIPFPPPDKPDVAEVTDPGPLRVIRFAPEGDVPIAPHLSVTFSHPMVAVTSHAAASETRPVRLHPEPPGTWRWIGTKTLLFEPDPRFPMATDFTVQVPAGVISATGQALDEGARWTFSTPAPTVKSWWPVRGPMDLEPVVLVVFDQAVPDSMLEHVVLEGGGATVPLRLATDSEIEAQGWVQQTLEATPDGRALAMIPREPLKPGTTYTIRVKKGAPSAEGPKVTRADQRQSFWTYHPLVLERTYCSHGAEVCTPSAALHLYFNNPLDVDAFDPSMVTVEPPLEDMQLRAGGAQILLVGQKEAETRYTVRVSPELKDTFGQALGKEVERTFQVRHAEPQLVGPGREVLILDPAGPPALSVFSMNQRTLRVRVYEAPLDRFATLSEWMRDTRYDGHRKGEPPLRRLARLDLPVDGFAWDELVENRIDLAPYLGEDGFGHVFVWVEPETQPREAWRQTHLFAWVQRSALGLTAVVDQDEIIAWATGLETGVPLEGVEVGLLGQPHTARTDQDGLAVLAKYPNHEGPHALVARYGDDVVLLPQNEGWWNHWGGWTAHSSGEELAWFVFDDRRLYKPGEELALKGWIRRYDRGPGGGVAGHRGLARQLEWRVFDSQGNKLLDGRGEISGFGSFDLRLTLPDTPNLGSARIELSATGEGLSGSTTHTFQIQEFRRPEFQVTTSLDPRPYLLGEHAQVSVHAGYFAGGPLPAAPVHWSVTGTPAHFAPPGHDRFRFGPWSPWWGHFGLWGRGGAPGEGTVAEHLAGQTDAAGDHALRIDFRGVNPPRPYTIRAEATVLDVNRQRWTRGEQLLLHPASEYVGLRASKGFYERGEEVPIEVIVADLDGNLVKRDVSLTWSRLEWARVEGVWQQVEQETEPCLVTAGAEVQTCRFVARHGGNYRARARITDSEGRPNETVLEVWVTGGDFKQAPSRRVSQETVTLVPEGSAWQPGDTARILVQSPFAPAEGLVTVGRNGVMETRRFRMDEPSATLEVPITEASVPNVVVRVDLVGAAERRDDDGEPLPDKAKRVAFAAGEIDLPVPPLKRTLEVSLAPRADAVDPGGSTVLDVEVRDADGRPVRAEVAVVAVDEAVLALAGYEAPDPIAAFYSAGSSGFTVHHDRGMVVLADPDTAGEAGSEGALLETLAEADMAVPTGGVVVPQSASMEVAATGSAFRQSAKQEVARRSRAGGEVEAALAVSAPAGNEGAPITVREDFAALALFAPRVQTDASGKAAVPITLPDSLTRYRLLAVAVAEGDRFGMDESALTARKPVMVRPSPPRFLNFGDRAELPVVIQNQTGAPVSVDLALRVANARVIDAVEHAPTGDPVFTAGRRLEIPAHDRREVRVPVAADMAGTARFQLVAVSGTHTDAAHVSIPVWTPATSEAFATYGEIDEGAIAQPVRAPKDAWPQFGGLEITTSSTALQALTDAVLYLVQYPYDSTEQMASKVLAVAALRDVLDAFEAEQLPPPAELEAAVDREIARLVKRQLPGGGFAFWPQLPDEPYLTVHVAHALVRARSKGFEVPDATLNRVVRYLEHIERHIPADFSKEARWTIIAYSVHVRHLLGQDDATRAARLMAEAGTGLPLEAQGWIAPVLQATRQGKDVQTLLRHWENRAVETAAGAQFSAHYTDQADYVLLHSSRRTDAVLLEALIAVRPDHDLIPKLVRALLGHRKAGRWSTTQENSLVLLALDRYFRQYESVTPDFVARMWLGDRFAGEHAFQGRTTERVHVQVPLAWMTDPPVSRDLVLQKQGAGRLYYRVGMRYAPKDLKLEPADHGFAVERTYEAVDDPGDVRQDEEGTWRIRAGSRVRVRVRMVAPARRTHVALVDPLPAGLEPLNPELATTGAVPTDPNASTSRYWWWSRPWYEHQNMRDERVEAFSRLVWPGVHEYSYVATATTPGHFVVPPAKAEEMYHPETFGRTGTDLVIVEHQEVFTACCAG